MFEIEIGLECSGEFDVKRASRFRISRRKINVCDILSLNKEIVGLAFIKVDGEIEIFSEVRSKVVHLSRPKSGREDECQPKREACLQT